MYSHELHRLILSYYRRITGALRTTMGKYGWEAAVATLLLGLHT
jgi:hypothetical protein